MSVRTSLAHVVLLPVLLLLQPPPAWAAIECFKKPFDKYGHVPNTDAGICAAAATINSFVYLRNTYPGIYGNTNIVPDWNKDGEIDEKDYVESRDKIANGWTYGDKERKGIYSNPSGSDPKQPDQDWWLTKMYWFDDFAPGTTIFDGQVYGRPGATKWYKGDVLEDKYPEWSFLWKQIYSCEDVELGIYPKDGGVGHAITLTGLCWEDKDGDKSWDPGETPNKILYADPNQRDWKAPMEGLVAVTGGRIEFKWWQDEKIWYIDHAWSESPIPEPASVIVWSVLAILGITVTWRQRTDRGCGS